MPMQVMNKAAAISDLREQIVQWINVAGVRIVGHIELAGLFHEIEGTVQAGSVPKVISNIHQRAAKLAQIKKNG